MKLRLPLYLVFVLCIPVGLSHAGDVRGKVIHITDGDTITVLNQSKRQIKVRLNGIDCPEKNQAYGTKAKEFTKGLVALQTVTVATFGKDRYGRTIGEVILDDGRNLNQELVRAGMAWWYRKYAPGDMVLKTLEADARAAKRGLWKDPHPIPPWDFRHRGDRATLKPKPYSSPSSPVNSSSGSFDALPVIGNLRSGIYHRFDCPSYDAVAPHNRLLFPSVQAAEQAGFEVAGNCP